MTRYKKQDPEITRRRFINTALGASAAVGGLSLISTLGGANPVFRLTPEKAPPMEGDILVHADPAKFGQPIKVSELSEKLIRAWPQGKDPKTGAAVVRNGDPTSILAIYRFPKGELKEPTKLDATVDGEIVVYGNRCTHAGCNVEDGPKGIMNCPCHSGQYDAKRGCVVVGGPPEHPLPQLPVKVEGDQLVATGFFLSEPYGYHTEEDWQKYTEKVEELLS